MIHAISWNKGSSKCVPLQMMHKLNESPIWIFNFWIRGKSPHSLLSPFLATFCIALLWAADFCSRQNKTSERQKKPNQSDFLFSFSCFYFSLCQQYGKDKIKNLNTDTTEYLFVSFLIWFGSEKRAKQKNWRKKRKYLYHLVLNDSKNSRSTFMLKFFRKI